MTTTLVSTDQDTEEGRYCPKCHADWRATQIPIESVVKGYYGHVAPCTKLQSWDPGYYEYEPCSCPPRYYSRLCGIETRGYDGVSFWTCPDCGTVWDRWTRKEVVHSE